MSASTVPVRPEADASLRPVPWRRMVWVTWRQHRVALAGAAALLLAVAVEVWVAGRQLHHAYAAATGCHPAGALACDELVARFDRTDKLLRYGYLLQPLPALIGAFVAAPVLARELETGRYRFAWTQGFGRSRWTLAKLVLLAGAVAALAGALSVLLSWYYEPYLATGNGLPSPAATHVPFTEWSPLAPGLFDLRGVAFAAWTLAAFAIGGLAGALIRRVVPAIVATLVAYAGLALAAALYLRRHYLTPLVTSDPHVPGSAWITSQWWDRGSTFAFAGRPPIGILEQLCPPSALGPGKPSSGTLAQCLSQHGYTQWTAYQPAGRFWPFQLIEGGWLLALSALLMGATLWIVRRRAA